MIVHGEEASASSAEDLKQKISDDMQSVSDFARKEASTVSAKAKEAASDQKNILAAKLGGVAEAMEKVAGELESGDNRDIGKLTRNLGDNLRSASDRIQDRSIGEIASMAEDFGRKQPLAFLSIAAVAGLAASRFLTASAPKSGTVKSGAVKSGAVKSGTVQNHAAASAAQAPAHNTPSTYVASTSLAHTEGRARD